MSLVDACALNAMKKLNAEQAARLDRLLWTIDTADSRSLVTRHKHRLDGYLLGLQDAGVISEEDCKTLEAEAAVREHAAAVRAEQLNRSIGGGPELERMIQDELADTIRDLARQDSPEFRGQYYGECRGMLKVLRLGEMLDEAQREQWSADIYRASLQAADQCVSSGQPVDGHAVNRQRFQLQHLAERGIIPRERLPR
ncbi:TPA: hypothetical protein RJN82_006297 [Pseudomonas aeruginosa]|uniref:hypothetical protein n=1 Tax=Pseudomonas aeruginosa TaxID=287 RepID=UPI00053D44D2|nr:hypothetical protein [Pseudomonas aeruginosa]MCO4022193.1 hypothetical protein [Pseudomonas aeruginosa]MCS7987242.1 hypothetical protein [Pseudomonas aeruginosa]MCS9097772.1 hypothetical protein [Pseudomonas aeruginosa]OPA49952.1 hypothetical protein BZY57_19310 [Pseudomonas aeruginosa]RZN95236.1 hypothetical protein EVV10_33690 [Pseudomonas aeruginosa]